MNQQTEWFPFEAPLLKADSSRNALYIARWIEGCSLLFSIFGTLLAFWVWRCKKKAGKNKEL